LRFEPRIFRSTPRTALPHLSGLGSREEIDPDLLIPDKSLSLREGAIAALEWSGPHEEGGFTGR
jgi:excinuclease ABC subunit A